jgi:hypothetical protein
MKKIMRFLLLSCLKATELIEKKLYTKLSISEKIRLSLHKSMCNACRRYENQSKLIDSAIEKNGVLHTVDLQKFTKELKEKLEEKSK